LGNLADIQAASGPRLEMSPSLALHVSPILVARMQILALTSVEFEHVLEHELAEDPALERADEPPCASDGSGPCRVCNLLPWNAAPRVDRSDPQPPITDPTALDDPRSTLLHDLLTALDRELDFVAEYVIASVDERGYLDADPTEISSALGVPIEHVQRVLDALRPIAPPGFAARDVRESLLLQLVVMEAERPLSPLVRAVVDQHLDAVARGQISAVSRRLQADATEVRAAVEFIRTNLRAHPSEALLPASWSPAAPVVPVIPDVVIHSRKDDDGFDVDLVEPHRFPLRIDRTYRHLSELMRTRGSATGVSDRDSQHVLAYTTRADAFITRVRERWRTIQDVSRYVAERQADFLRDGPRSLRSLTRAEVACELGVHGSTVSRATAGKFVMLPAGSVIPFHDLFDRSLGARDVLREIIATEPRPLSDASLADELTRRGYPLARRTVTKYRERIGVPVSAAR
jgi:RNA polymerase sigma-54 factor